jgi:hypothetical protein
LKENKIDKVNNLTEFYESAYNVIKKLIENNMKTYFDAYMFKYKDNNLNLIV